MGTLEDRNTPEATRRLAGDGQSYPMVLSSLEDARTASERLIPWTFYAALEKGNATKTNVKIWRRRATAPEQASFPPCAL